MLFLALQRIEIAKNHFLKRYLVSMKDCSCCSRKAKPTIATIPTIRNVVLVLVSNFSLPQWIQHTPCFQRFSSINLRQDSWSRNSFIRFKMSIANSNEKNSHYGHLRVKKRFTTYYESLMFNVSLKATRY